jgi:hypothetical protein
MTGRPSMSRQPLVSSVALAALLLGVSACGGSDGGRADPTPTKTSASPTPTTPVQPKGADGVTYEIQNWDAYAADPAVLAWKQIFEASNGSINRGKLLPLARTGLSKPVLRILSGNLDRSIKSGWHVKPLAKVKVESARTSGSSSRVVVCLWAPSTGLYDSKGGFVGEPERFWKRLQSDLSRTSGAWVIDTNTLKGKCPGGEPG